jgi:putative phosphoesterase
VLDHVAFAALSYLPAASGEWSKPMRIVIISDLHANADALAALNEPYDELWVLGDLVNYGPEPEAVIDQVRRRATLIVSGNHDYAVGHASDPRCSPPFRAMAEATQRYTMTRLSDEDKAYLRGLPLTLTCVRDGRRVYLCHATPSDPLFAYCPPDSPQWIEEVAHVDADIVLVGHTHLPFINRIGLRQVVNPGSLGQPKHGGPQASYAVWQDGEITLRTVAYPLERTIHKLQQLPLPTDIVNALAHLLQTGVPMTVPDSRSGLTTG